MLERVGKIARDTPGVDKVITISGISVLDNNASLPSAGLAYVMLKDWSARKGQGPGPAVALPDADRALKAEVLEAATTIIPPPPIQGIGNAGGFTLMIQLKDGSGDFVKLQAAANQIVSNAASQSALQAIFTSFRATTPQLHVSVDRNKAETLGVTVVRSSPQSRTISDRATSPSSTSSGNVPGLCPG